MGIQTKLIERQYYWNVKRNNVNDGSANMGALIRILPPTSPTFIPFIRQIVHTPNFSLNFTKKISPGYYSRQMYTKLFLKFHQENTTKLLSTHQCVSPRHIIKTFIALIYFILADLPITKIVQNLVTNLKMSSYTLDFFETHFQINDCKRYVIVY